ncbi:MAG: ABC transporter permease [Deltaproteobacteria bacterium]|nr:ABC transporter permease [Deltaproteobacteria bacterium]
MYSLWLLTLARVREFLREPGAVFWTFGFPVLLTVALGLAFRQEGAPTVKIAIVDGPRAQELAATLTGDRPGVKLAPQIMSVEDLRLALKRAQVVIGLDGNADTIVYYYDPQRPDAEGVRLAVDDVLQRRAGRKDVVATRAETAQQPGSRYVDWLVPGLLGMQLMSGGMWGVGWVVVDARQRKLMKRLVATPMRRSSFLLSFLLARLFGVFWEVGILVGFAALAFSVHTQGSVVAVFAIGFLGAAVFAGLGLLTACRAQNTQTASGLMNLAMLPMFILSGVFFSSVNFPAWLQPVINALPLTALNDALRGVMNDGASLVMVAPRLAVLSAWGAVAFAISLKWFRWT